MISSRDPFATSALVVAGALAGHELGYFVGAGSDTGHGYVDLVAPLAIAGVIAAMWGAAVSIMRRGGDRAPSAAKLAVAQSALYLAFEVGERLLGSTETGLFSLPVGLGLLAQPLVAWLAVRALRLSASLAAALLPFVGPPLTARPCFRAPSVRAADSVSSTTVPARAPPATFCP